MSVREHAETADETALDTWHAGEAWQQTAAAWGATALEVMRTVATTQATTPRDVPDIGITSSLGCHVMLHAGHTETRAHLLAAVMGIDIDREADQVIPVEQHDGHALCYWRGADDWTLIRALPTEVTS